jgi:hypothetical protein
MYQSDNQFMNQEVFMLSGVFFSGFAAKNKP